MNVDQSLVSRLSDLLEYVVYMVANLTNVLDIKIEGSSCEQIRIQLIVSIEVKKGTKEISMKVNLWMNDDDDLEWGKNNEQDIEHPSFR